MFRRLHTFVTLLSLALLLAVAAFWLRSSRRSDVFTLRTARSYSGWPPVKWVQVRTNAGIVLSFMVKTEPWVEASDPSWRDDVPAGYRWPGADGTVVVKRLMPPAMYGARATNAVELRQYEARVANEYAGAELLQWQSTPTVPVRWALRRGPTLLGRLGVSVDAWSSYSFDRDAVPGAYRQVRVRVPFALVTAAAAVLPLTWVAFWLTCRVVRRRLPPGLCRGCGYDLRESPTRCPECGRTVSRQEAEPAGGVPPAARPRRRWVVAGMVVACAVVLAVLLSPGASGVDGDRGAGVDTQPPHGLEAVRFTAIWPSEEGAPALPHTHWVGQFDVLGPLRATLKELPKGICAVAVDPSGRASYGILGMTDVAQVDPHTGSVQSIEWHRSAAQRSSRPAGLAFDPRRRRLLVIGQDVGATASTYLPDANKWAGSNLVADKTETDSVTYSETDDCYYALGRAATVSGPVDAITRIAADGTPEWRIPVPERVHNERPGIATQQVDRAQIAAAGPYLAIVTTLLPDPRDPGAPEKRRIVLIDPKPNTVLYSGPIGVH